MTPYRMFHKAGSVAEHHRSIKDLWEKKWRILCKLGVYPFFSESKIDDFENVFGSSVMQNMKPPYDHDVYAAAFFKSAEDLVRQAQTAEEAHDTAKAAELYLRAAALYRIARFPIVQTPKQREAWERNKEAFFKGAGLLEPPITDVHIPHTHGIEGEGPHIPLAVRIPSTVNTTSPVPVVIRICGLDGYRTEQFDLSNSLLERGWASVGVEIPGTGDSPARRGDPTSADRLWSSLLDWVDAQPHLDKDRRVVWGVSTGGYYATRIAMTHKDRLTGVVSHGGGCHGMFDPVWLTGMNMAEYPFPLVPALAEGFMFDPQDTKSMRETQRKYSLLENGLLGKDCAPLMLANGLNDTIFPIEDSFLLFQHGPAKSARFADAAHMGGPNMAEPIFGWIDWLFGGK
ncbi:alpha/beta-hydrolase [Aspergillus avenaceus]|uniref:Alpha/beta-hydrolase n=1 Tax=Aspergillus avenaceus TaxID=36643 RepID=A0A5N6U4R4_ASPAV|nr:alpha/beta-hydrolase [Aspergillus avenaceus]